MCFKSTILEARVLTKTPLGILWGALWCHCVLKLVLSFALAPNKSSRRREMAPLAPRTMAIIGRIEEKQLFLQVGGLPLRFTYIYIYTCSDKGDRKASQRAIAHGRKYAQDMQTIASHIY